MVALHRESRQYFGETARRIVISVVRPDAMTFQIDLISVSRGSASISRGKPEGRSLVTTPPKSGAG